MSRQGRFLLFASLTLLVACERGPTVLRLVAPAADLDREIAQDMAALVAQESQFRLALTNEQQAGEQALAMLLAGDADVAVVSNYLPYREGIATVMPLYPAVLHIAYREGRDASDGYALLDQTNIYAGPEGSASRLLLDRIVTRLGLPRDAYAYIERSEDSVLKDADIAILFAPISPQHAAELGGFRLFSFGSPHDIGSGSIIDTLALLNPALRPFVIPARTYDAANPGPVVTVAVDKILVARNDLDSTIVYDLINALRRLRPALSAGHPGLFDQLDSELDVGKSTFVVHAGTQDYLQRSEPTVYERYSGVAEVAVTLVIALVSTILAVFRILKRRRKNRIDRFYTAVLKIRDSVSHDANHDERDRAIRNVRELQNVAFDQLVAERLSADESFQIFITLANDVIRQLAQPAAGRS